MKNNTKNTYEFHFKMDNEMKDKLRNLKLYEKIGSLSGLIGRILAMLAPRIEKEHLAFEQRMSEYMLVNEDTTIVRESIHVYLPEQVYRKLKLLHHDLNFYSIAQLLRMMLRIFLDIVELYGNKFYSILLQSLRLWNKKRERRKYQYIPVRQLLHFIYQKPRISRFITLYSNKFAPVGMCFI